MTEKDDELKRLFDAECATAKQVMAGLPKLRRNIYPEAYAIVRLLNGVSSGKGRGILHEADLLLAEMARNTPIHADMVYQTIAPL